MQFEQKTITILDEERKLVKVTAWQGVGTGLAYHHPIYKDHPSGAEYILVHVPTGRALSKLTLPTVPEAQAFLEAVAALDEDKWNISEKEYMNRYYYAGRVMELQHNISAAYDSALIPRDQIFLYAVDKDGDPIDAETTDVESEDPEDAHTKECVSQFFGYYSGDVRVMLVRMDAKTYQHTALHTYERSTSIVAQSPAVEAHS